MKITPVSGNNYAMFLEDIERNELSFINFSGRDSRYDDKENHPSFGVRLSEEDAKFFMDRGWPVKWTKPNADHPEWESRPYIEITMYENNKNLSIVVITDGKQVRYSKDHFYLIDRLRIESISCRINMFNWEKAGRTGTKISSNMVYIVAAKDYLASKFDSYKEEEFVDAEQKPLDIDSDELPF